MESLTFQEMQWLPKDSSNRAVCYKQVKGLGNEGGREEGDEIGLDTGVKFVNSGLWASGQGRLGMLLW